ncbi:hypothetical protein J3R30DRAFT_3730302 [Lentinula aciculospora]|uniref:Fungal-type protein kinase domain-containing protein n=1 Tax=Lentinula aciculospora TaxID=153920 RepID=A0A9W9AR01_9AGAR|nr:hypothetical protein J3R30DRAFT_3730302 [Lentinula aciculospora]
MNNTIQQTFVLVANGNVPMYSHRGVSSRPNGFSKVYTKLQEKQQTGSEKTKKETLEKQGARGKLKNDCHLAYDLANPHQYKLHNSQNDANDDFGKLVNDMQQILTLDPCHRFTFGTTIENRTIRLWLLSRATLLWTATFEFIQLRSPPACGMGWDTTIIFSHSDADRRQHDIEGNGDVYTTVDVLSDSAADSPLCCATRVWKVRDSNGKIRVLKDIWLEPDRLEEHKIRADILADAKALNKKKPTDNFDQQRKKRMHKPLGYCRVHVNGQEDDTDTRFWLALVTSLGSRQPNETQQTVEYPQPRRTILERASTNATTNHQRYHYRIVFEQCATTICDERNMDNIFRAIVEVVKALYVLHSAGWVQRDISGGNVYWYQDECIGLLVILSMPPALQIEGTTCTPFFMAAETLVNRYLFTPAQRDLETITDEEIDFDLDRTRDDIDLTCIPVVTATLPFCYNPLHDLESIWWIIVYVLFFNDDACISHKIRRVVKIR